MESGNSVMNGLSRRNFMIGAGCGAVLSSAPAWGRVLGANDRVNVAMIGQGYRGPQLLDCVLDRTKNQRDVQVVAFCDVYQKRLNEAVAKVPGSKGYTSHMEMLQRSDVDAVFIATPDQWHAPMILAAMEAGKDVYVEKPMTHTVEEAKVVAKKAAEMKRIVQVGVQGLSWRRWPKLKGIIDSGALGQVIAVQGTYSRNDPAGDWNWTIDPQAGPDGVGENHIDWKQWLGSAPERPFNADRFFRFRKYWDYSGGIATDLHYHVVAPLLYAVGADFPARVAGMGGRWVYNDGREVPDTFLTAADYPSKYSLTVQSSQINENGPTLLIRGTKATLALSDEWEGAPARRYDYGDLIPESPFAEEFAKKNAAEFLRIDNVGNDGDQLHVDNFIECVRSRKQPNCPAELGYKTVATIDLSVRSYREGKVYRYDGTKEQVFEANKA